MPAATTPAGRADLHTHTTASDGLLSPEQLVGLARQRGLAAIAITDHDTVDGVSGALTIADPGLRVVPGVEMSCVVDGADVHLLGYGIDVESPGLTTFLTERANERRSRAAAIVDRLAEIGVPVSLPRVTELAGSGTVGRPHVARALVEAGHVSSIGNAFDLYLGNGRPAHVERPELTPQRAIDVIHAAGGAAVLAHPLYSPGYADFLPDLVAAGLDGLEVVYPDHNEATERRLAALAASHRLIATGGSDFHADSGRPGHGLGESAVPASVIDLLAARASDHHPSGPST